MSEPKIWSNFFKIAKLENMTFRSLGEILKIYTQYLKIELNHAKIDPGS